MVDGNGRGGVLSAGGILSIITGAFEVIAGGLIAALTTLSIPFWHPEFPFAPGFWGTYGIAAIPKWILIVGIVLVVLGIVAIVGGVSAVRRTSFGLSLAGAICALLPFNLLGLLAVIFVSVARREFVTGF
jgi:hypothetical protein